MHGQSVELSVVVPVYRSEACIPRLLAELDQHLPQAAAAYEIILVDDDSPDRSWEAIQRESALYPRVRAVQLMKNAGQVQATLCGLELARGEIIVTMDDDLQHPPDQVARLVEALKADPALDCVFGTFAERQQQGYRTVGSRIIGWVHAITYRLPQGVRPSSFRAMRRILVDAIVQDEARSPSLNVAILDMTRRVGAVPVTHAERFAGKSNYTLARQLRQAFDNLSNASNMPLRATWLLGSMFCGLGLAAGIVALGLHLFGMDVYGSVWLALELLLVAGMMLLVLGFLAEHLARSVRRVRGGNRFVVRETHDPLRVDRHGTDVRAREP